MKTSSIRSIGWLNCADGSVNLTPCFNGNSRPTFVNISMSELKQLDGDQERMKSKAIEILTNVS